MVYLFFLVLPKLADAEDDIIYQKPVRYVSVTSFITFALGFILFVGSVV